MTNPQKTAQITDVGGMRTSLMSLISASTPLLADVRQLIDSARQRVASTVNAELTQLCWQKGSRVNAELLKGQRAFCELQQRFAKEA